MAEQASTRSAGRTPRAGRNSPQIRAFAVTAGVAGHGRIPLRCDAAASFRPSQKYSFIYRITP